VHTPDKKIQINNKRRLEQSAAEVENQHRMQVLPGTRIFVGQQRHSVVVVMVPPKAALQGCNR
jgi:hypothetical protein